MRLMIIPLAAVYLDFTFDERTPLMTAGHVELRATPVPSGPRQP